MRPSTQQLYRVHEHFFVNLGALDAVRFEDGDEEITAHLTFTHGGSETVTGVAARSLHEKLTTGYTDEKALQQSRPEEEGASDADLIQPTPAFNFDFTPTSSGRNKGWFYGKDESGRALILAFVNAKGSCSVRPFDAEKNIALGKRYGSGRYQEHFSNLVRGATELFVDSQPNLERDCKQQLPERLFVYLRKQIDEVA